MYLLTEQTFIAYWEKRDQIVILHKRLFGSMVEFFGGISYMQCELGPESDFIIIGEL